MAKDMLKLDAFKDVLGETVQMVKFFEDKHRLNGRPEEAQRSLYGAAFSLQTPVETRWMSHHNAPRSSSPRRHCNAWWLPRTSTRSAKVQEGRT